MGKRQKNLVDRAHREARQSAFFRDMDVDSFRTLAIGLVVGIVAILVILVPFSGPRFLVQATGRPVGEFSFQNYAGPPEWIVSVRLDNGDTISLAMPKDQKLRTDAAMKVDVYEQGYGPIKWNSYRFKGYAETPAR
jgi:hypothetical protein